MSRVEINGEVPKQQPGTTLLLLRTSYPACWLESEGKDHRNESYVLENGKIYVLKQTTAAASGPVSTGLVPTVARSGILECLTHMTEVKVKSKSSGEEYTILKCDDNSKLSVRVSKEFPDFVLIRQCTLDIIALIQDKVAQDVGRFLITGTPGVGKTVSVVVWLYLVLKGALKMSFKHIIADLKTGCILLSRTETGTWVEEWCKRDILMIRGFPSTLDVLYLYDATHQKLPLILPAV